VLQPEIVVEVAVEECPVHIQKDGIYVVPVEFHGKHGIVSMRAFPEICAFISFMSLTEKLV
jgi:hypothetical protein